MILLSLKNQNKLEPEHIKRIVDTYKIRESIEKYAYLASLKRLKKMTLILTFRAMLIHSKKKHQ